MFNSASRASTRRTLASTIAALFLSSPAMASNWTVTTCDDDASTGSTTTHSGSLRFIAEHAANNETIDTQLACSVITLRNGAITFPQDNITLNGPGRDTLSISGKYAGNPEHDRIIDHTGHGWLKIYDLSLGYGYLDSNASSHRGGCIYSAGNVWLTDAAVGNCRIYSNNNSSGGGVYAKGQAILVNSTLSGNSLDSPGHSNVDRGGGLYARGDLTVINSTISGNTIHSGDGGGIAARGGALIYYSTISGNSAGTSGAIYAVGALKLSSSTISGNYL